MQAYSDPKRENDPRALPDVEVFSMAAEDFLTAEEDTWMYAAVNETTGESMAEIAGGLAGWYYWFCFPGCLPDSDPIGPFETEEEALEDAQEGSEQE